MFLAGLTTVKKKKKSALGILRKEPYTEMFIKNKGKSESSGRSYKQISNISKGKAWTGSKLLLKNRRDRNGH